MTQRDEKAAQLVEMLLSYGLKYELIKNDDVIFCRNQLLDLLNIQEPYDNPDFPWEDDIPETATPILEELLDYADDKGMLPENTLVYRDLLDTKIMGIITPLPSQLIDRFNEIKETQGVQIATEDFYNTCKRSDYIRMDRIAKNQEWDYESNFGTLNITINLTKPEKDPREIAALKNAPQVGYPQCVLCPENVGYAGRVNHPARQTLRTLPVELGQEKWRFQYSPYVYYNQHCIVLNEQHIPMRIKRKTFKKLFDFLELFPHYFIGSNADLPIVGGSILNHDHFQGGYYTFPMERSPIEYSLSSKGYPEMSAGVLNWPMSTLRLTSIDSKALTDIAYKTLELWRDYSDPSAGILSQSLDEGGQATPHNTITPIARKNSVGLYELDLVFRNNRTSPEYPLGIFHPHPEIHHIKKENIGLIEVMGLFILPGRLQKELSDIKDLLTGKGSMSDENIISTDHPLHQHKEWIEELIQNYGSENNDSRAQKIIEDEVGEKCEQVLKDGGVFKTTAEGRNAFNKFLEVAGFTLE
ncbi:MAG TPA: UDP-glucose--hexose-1-phosphate uridylyltransferase [Clostridia bacterium]|nr:UDP-glucose--hexose-1-phosphate uridylyltransferase [Clostridia bacterium]